MYSLLSLLLLSLINHTYAQAQTRPPFDIDKFNNVRLIHGVVACLAFVAFFPLGAIAIRILPGKWALRVHLTCQLIAYGLFIAAVGLGVSAANTLKLVKVNLFMHRHLIIGETVFALLALQIVLGVVHHVLFRKYGKRQVWSHLHTWLGRALITLGIVNGGIGMQLGELSRTATIVYRVFAALVWVAWMGISVYGEMKKFRTRKEESGETRPESMENRDG